MKDWDVGYSESRQKMMNALATAFQFFFFNKERTTSIEEKGKLS